MFLSLISLPSLPPSWLAIVGSCSVGLTVGTCPSNPTRTEGTSNYYMQVTQAGSLAKGQGADDLSPPRPQLDAAGIQFSEAEGLCQRLGMSMAKFTTAAEFSKISEIVGR